MRAVPHEPLASYDRRAAWLLGRVREVGAGCDTADGDDLIHMDYHPGDIIVSGGQITGLVDWDGAARGDRHLGLVTLRFDLAARAPQQAGRLDDLLPHAVTTDRLRSVHGRFEFGERGHVVGMC